MSDASFSEQVKNEIEAKIDAALGEHHAALFACISEHRDTMERLVKNLAETGVENGMWFCKGPGGGCNVGDVCVGTACNVILRGCNGDNALGTFHTHPTGESYPSSRDIQHAIFHSEKFNCIGSTREGIRCYSIRWGSPEVDEYLRLCQRKESELPITDESHHVLKDAVRAIVESGVTVPSRRKSDLRDFDDCELMTYEFWDLIGDLPPILKKHQSVIPGGVEMFEEVKRIVDRYNSVLYGDEAYFNRHWEEMFVEHKM